MLKTILSVLLIAIAFQNCSKKNESCNYDACAYKAPATEIQAVKDYLSAQGINAAEHCSGLFYVIDNAGNGKAPTACNIVSTTYTGKLTNGNTFDQGTLSFSLGEVIRGWTNGIPLVKSGGKIHLYIPPSLGYGAQDMKDQNGVVVIPANSILVFDVTLNGVN